MKIFLTTLLLISLRLFPVFYFLTLGLAGIATFITEQALDIYAVTFRPFVYAVLMFAVLQALSHKRVDLFNKYFWYGIKGADSARIIYLWLKVIVGVFGIACLTSGFITVLIGSGSPLSMFNIRDDIFYPAVAAFLISPIFMTLHLRLKSVQGLANKTMQKAA